jgi:hypothetical protein
VAFQVDGQRAAAGALEVTAEGVVLKGRRRGEPVELHVSSDELLSLRIGRHPTERLDGYTTVVLAWRSGEVWIAPFGLVLLHEVTDLLATLRTRIRMTSLRGCPVPACGSLVVEDVLAEWVPVG